METERLVLRKVRIEDVDTLYEARNSTFVLQHNAMKKITIDEMKNLVIDHLKNDNIFCLELKETKNAIGMICINDDSLRFNTQTKELSYWLDEKYSFNGYMSEALSEIIDYLFSTSHIKGITARCFKENIASQNLLKKLGFKKEGILKNAVCDYRNIIHDDVLYYLENTNLNYVYILRCKQGHLYTGWTTNLEKRLKMHNSKNGAKYTKAFGPCELAYYEVFDSKEEAMKREYQIKQLTKQQKENLIYGE